MNKSLMLRVAAFALAFSLLAAACGGGSTDTGSDSTDSSSQTSEATAPETEEDTATETESAAAPAVDTPAATLTRDLTALLADHEYLAGASVLMAVQAKGDLKDPSFVAAAGALDKNSIALSEAIASVYGKAGGEQFLSLWRAHIGFFVDYTLGQATGDKAMAAKAEKKLDGYRNDFGAFIEGATEGGLPADAVADALTPHVDSTKDAIDSVVAGDGKAFDKLREAASHLPGIATALSGAIVTQFPDKF